MERNGNRLFFFLFFSFSSSFLLFSPTIQRYAVIESFRERLVRLLGFVSLQLLP